MAISTFVSTERPEEVVGHDFGECCGERPLVLKYRRNETMSVYCRNPSCHLSEERGGVIAHIDDIDVKWRRARMPASRTKRDVDPFWADLCEEYAGKLIGKLTQTAVSHGYALAIHGSKRRDIDLLAVPWSEEAVAADKLAAAVYAMTAGGFDPHPIGPLTKFGGNKPHGRIGWFIHLPGGPYIDLSVMPIQQQS